jgi:LPXTG-motif cell wall-anchored protein
MTTSTALTDLARSCTATIGSLPNTGNGVSAWLIPLALALLAAGAALLLLVRRRRTGAAMLTLLAAALLVTPHDAAPAYAETAQHAKVDYGNGCTLITVDDSAITWGTPATTHSLLPGDDIVAVTVPLTNTADTPIHVTGVLQIQASTGLTGDVEFDHATGPVLLKPGQHTTATATVRLPPDAGNQHQATATPLQVVLTATAR